MNFPFRSPLPKLAGIYVNRQLICSGSGEKNYQTTTLNLNFDLTTGIKAQQIQPTIKPTYAPVYKPQTQQTHNPPITQVLQRNTEPATFRPQTFTPPTQAPHSQTQYGPDSQVCGLPIIQGTGFIVGGKVATRGQWPW